LYQEAADVQPPRSSTAANAVDFQLLRLAAGDLLGTQPAVGLAELLRPAGKASTYLFTYILMHNSLPTMTRCQRCITLFFRHMYACMLSGMFNGYPKQSQYGSCLA